MKSYQFYSWVNLSIIGASVMNRLTSMTITHELGFPPIGARRQSLSDQVLDMSFTLGNVPERAGSHGGDGNGRVHRT